MVGILEGSVWSQVVICVYTCAMSEVCTVMLIYPCCLIFVRRSHQSARDASKENKEQIRNRIWNETNFYTNLRKYHQMKSLRTRRMHQIDLRSNSFRAHQQSMISNLHVCSFFDISTCHAFYTCIALQSCIILILTFENFFLLICIHQMITSMMYHTNGTLELILAAVKLSCAITHQLLNNSLQHRLNPTTVIFFSRCRNSTASRWTTPSLRSTATR